MLRFGRIWGLEALLWGCRVWDSQAVAFEIQGAGFGFFHGSGFKVLAEPHRDSHFLGH